MADRLDLARHLHIKEYQDMIPKIDQNGSDKNVEYNKKFCLFEEESDEKTR